MSIFRKKDNKISDAQAYLRSTDNVSRPTAILMSFVAFLAVFAIVFSLFLGGRWLYERMNDESRSDDTVAQSDNTDEASSETSTENNSGLGITVVNGTGQDIAGTVAENLNNDSDNEAEEPAATATGAQQLPNTGPAGNMAIAAGVVILSAVGHNLYSRKRV